MNCKFDSLSVAIATFALGTCLLSPAEAQTQVLGDSVTVVNTFEDAQITGGVQTVFGLDGPATILEPGVEFPSFIGFYDVDISDNSLTMTLIDSSQAFDLILPSGRFDRYYFGFDSSTITSASLDGLAGLNEFATVEVLPPGFQLNFVDLFNTGIPVEPIEFDNGGFLVEFGEGSDLSNLGGSAQINFTASKAVPESQITMAPLLLGGLMFASSALRKRLV